MFYQRVNEITEPFKGILLDAYGVFWGGNEFGLLPYAKEAMEELVAKGKIVGVLSNATALSTKEIEKLAKHHLNLGEHFHFLVTSGDVGKKLFLNQALPFQTVNKKFYIYFGDHPKFASHKAIFEGTLFQETQNLNEADFVYIAVPHLKGEDQVDPEIFKEDLLKLKDLKIPIVCPNPDHFAHEGNPPKSVVRQGSIAKLCEEMGLKIFYIGKPHANAFLEAMLCFNQYGIENPKEILMVGDTPETDIRGGKMFGMHTALLTERGIMRDRIEKFGLENIPLLPQDIPDYFLGFL